VGPKAKSKNLISRAAQECAALLRITSSSCR
jgi:hypothetical protein